MPSYPVIAQEAGSAPIYLVDVLNVTKWHIPTGDLYHAILALGYTKTTVPAGTLAQFPTIANPILPSIAAAGDEDTQFTSLVEAAVTASLRQAGLIK